MELWDSIPGRECFRTKSVIRNVENHTLVMIEKKNIIEREWIRKNL